MLLALWALAPAGPARADAPARLVAEIRRAYSGVQDLEARFIQTSRMVSSGLEQEARGRVVLGRGGKMRWTYEGDDPQEIVSDGRTLWIYQVRDRTVIRQDLASLSPTARVALDLLGGLEGVEDRFALGSCGDRCLVLAPRDPETDIKRVEIELAPDRPQVRSVTTEDLLGNRTRVVFEDVRTNVGVPDEVFAFRVPEGVQVVGGGDALR